MTDDGVEFWIRVIGQIGKETGYICYSAPIAAVLGKTRQTPKVDVIKGDFVPPREIEYRFTLTPANRTTSILAHDLGNRPGRRRTSTTLTSMRQHSRLMRTQSALLAEDCRGAGTAKQMEISPVPSHWLRKPCDV
ncbi:MAG: hypothetical protein LBP92_01810 [Deltaproteobacteria bacterium]|jgi:hypothetical protein|nr:hypothetical protein [Deltaproteobacteria bacterium]